MDIVLKEPSTSKLLIVGTGGLAREFASFFSQESQSNQIIGFLGLNRDEYDTFNLPGKLFLGEVSPNEVGTDIAVIAIGSPRIRKRLSEDLKGKGFSFPSFVHPSSIVSATARIAEGVVISPHAVVSPNVAIGAFTYLNFACGVGHDAQIGSFVQINPGAQIGGHAKVGEGCLIGSGATVLENVSVGRNSTIASGAAVFSRVAESATMLGNPAKRLRIFERD